MIYLDSSALLKLIRVGDESGALGEWLSARPDEPGATSELGRVEVIRAARRIGERVSTEARAVIGDVDLVPLNRAVQDLACDIADPGLRTLDALHLASAVLLGGELTAFVTYDHRLASAARTAGLVVTVPGQSASAER